MPEFQAYTNTFTLSWLQKIGLQVSRPLCYNVRMFRKIIVGACLLATCAPALAAEWMTDLEAAKTRAAAENKAVLIDFTGSDWCGWCIRLRKQVLDTPAFEAYAQDKFVLVEVDVPQNPKFDPALRARNEKLCEQFQVQGFPTILVITPQGDVAGGFSGFKPSVDETARTLDAALATAALLRQAETQQGADKLATLLKAYRSIPATLQPQTAALRKRIVELDPQDTSGLGHQQLLQDQRNALATALAAATSPAEALNILNQALATAAPENKSDMLQLKFQMLLMGARSVDDVKAALAVGRQAIEADTSAQPTDLQQFDAAFAHPEEVLKRLQRVRARQSATPKK